ncbi:MAG TPA: hypothetical protein PLL75_03625 [Candidatus Omnitrophota bacterium]|nr:hypothetical protein [Candidatus Omnitrophota bacterium]HPS36798.1 hypothetical protein [Candidatus Omnitrophota bacterium]
MKRFFFFAACLATVLVAVSTKVLYSEETSKPSFLPLSSLAVPESVGKIQERFTGRGVRTILQVQDVHAHLLAQENIAAILDHLSAVSGIRTIALEGAWSATDLPKSRAIPTSREKQLLARSLMDQDLISGPVYAAILSPEPLKLLGVEDAPLYEKNRELFLRHLAQRDPMTGKIRAYGKNIRTAQDATWNPALLAFGKAFGQFRETADLGTFFSVLVKIARAREIAFSDLDQIGLLEEILAREKMLSQEQLQTEIRHLMQQYKNTSWNFEELLRAGKIPEDKLAFYPELKKLQKIFFQRDKLSLSGLVSQVELLTTRTLEKLATTAEEKTVWDQSERFYLAERLLLLKATPADLRALKKEGQALETEVAAAELSGPFALALEFYDTVKQRDEIFFRKLTEDPSLSGDVVIVTGGFHTDGLSQRFRDAGISFITITPDLGKEPANIKLYEERMGETRKTDSPDPSLELAKPAPGLKKAEGQTLSELRNAIAQIDNRFAASYDVLLKTKDVRKAVDAFTGNASVHSNPERPASAPSHRFDITEFTKQDRSTQLQTVRDWLLKLRAGRQKAMLVSQASVIARMLTDGKVPELIEGILQGKDSLVLQRDIPLSEVPQSLQAARGVRLFETANLDTLQKDESFRRMARKHSFALAIMKAGYQSDAFVVLPEKPVSLVLYRIVALNPNLYQAAKNPEFFRLLENLVTEVLAGEASQKAA